MPAGRGRPWPGAGWKRLEPFPFAEAGPFTGVSRDPEALGLSYYRRPDGSFVALALFGAHCEGAPGQAHGGSILTALDEALGAAAWNAGFSVLTARLTTQFRRPVPLGSLMLVETELRGRRLRLVRAAGRLLGADGRVYASAEGSFFELDQTGRRRLFGPAR
ncbi:MAG: PaaI family thioesterase [Elusimicrobia bacterium]|nr:PaaI family thioesterase [Elusimicrobiota bacterium]MDE2236780.1 PaaI family thioesterase [Elusimicrobiota bacterium]MDE2426104.1 PaaI family thioesterase [Elusimicrobiota bacterium]